MRKNRGNCYIAQELAQFASNLSFSSLPKDVIHHAKRFMIDALGCIIGGKNEKSSEIIAEIVRDLGGTPESTVIGFNYKTSCVNAALVNGTIGHAIEMDDVHRKAIVHNSIVTLPSVLAVGEKVGASGSACIAAYIIGCEASIRIGEAFLGNLLNQGFHPTAVCGVFGSALAAGKILGLNQDQMTKALGIAGSHVSGLSEYHTTGAWTKRLQAGHPNFAGVLSALLASKDYTAPPSIIEGKEGLLESYSYQKKYDSEIITKNLGEKFEMINTSIKPYACCRLAHPIIDCTLALVNKYDLHPEDIYKVEVGTGENTLRALTKPSERKYKPKNQVDAQFSLPFSVAVSIAKRRALSEEFSYESIRDPGILNLCSKVTTYLSEEAESKWPEYWSAEVTIKTIDGRKMTEKTDYPKGDPENPISEGELREKFYDLSGRVYNKDQIDKIYSCMNNLELVSNIREITSIF